MERTSDLLAQVELARLAGRNLEQIETELLSGGHVDEDEQAPACPYAWARGPGISTAAAGSERSAELAPPRLSKHSIDRTIRLRRHLQQASSIRQMNRPQT